MILLEILAVCMWSSCSRLSCKAILFLTYEHAGFIDIVNLRSDSTHQSTCIRHNNYCDTCLRQQVLKTAFVISQLANVMKQDGKVAHQTFKTAPVVIPTSMCDPVELRLFWATLVLPVSLKLFCFSFKLQHRSNNSFRPAIWRTQGWSFASKINKKNTHARVNLLSVGWNGRIWFWQQVCACDSPRSMKNSS